MQTIVKAIPLEDAITGYLAALDEKDRKDREIAAEEERFKAALIEQFVIQLRAKIASVYGITFSDDQVARWHVSMYACHMGGYRFPFSMRFDWGNDVHVSPGGNIEGLTFTDISNMGKIKWMVVHDGGESNDDYFETTDLVAALTFAKTRRK